VVVERLAQEGERVEDRPIVRVAQLDPLRVELVMPAARWGSVDRGDVVTLLPDLPGGGKLMAKVTHVDKTLDAASNTFRVRLALPNPDYKVPAGARCRVDEPSADASPTANPARGA
jgi:multidrug efflux pump subunit AcrA (membrane-fusion protein)